MTYTVGVCVGVPDGRRVHTSCVQTCVRSCAGCCVVHCSIILCSRVNCVPQAAPLSRLLAQARCLRVGRLDRHEPRTLPTLWQRDYYTVPSMRELACMAPAELRSVQGFRVGHQTG